MLLDKLFDNLSLTVEPFATCKVAEGWRLNLPSPDLVTFHYVMEGDGELRLGSGELLTLRTNALAIMPAGTPHSIQCGSVSEETGVEGQGDPGAPICELVAGPLEQLRLTMACGRIQAKYAGGIGLFDHLNEAVILEFDGTPKMRGVFEALIEEYRRSGPASAAMMAALMNQCLIDVLRRLNKQAEGTLPWLSALEDVRLAKVMQAIVDHPEQPYTLDSLADIANMSRSTFIRHFEQSFGRSSIDYLRDVRLGRAAQLLKRNGISIDNVANKVGFASRSQFSRAFQSQFGCSPTDFRSQP